MKVLFIAPLPPPITGQALASEVLLDGLRKNFEVDVVNFNKGSFNQGINSIKRIWDVFLILIRIKIKSRKSDLIYLTISQSVAGNIKDILTLLICFSKIKKTILHLHGGGIKNIVYDKYKLLYIFNKKLLKKIGAVIVLGESLTNIFNSFIPKEKIQIIKNFADDYLFIERSKIFEKFADLKTIKILFLSNLIEGKGHYELLTAYSLLDECNQNQIEIHFAGNFNSNIEEKKFLEKLSFYPRIFYHGPVFELKKQKLFFESHIFCLPTYYYYYEGQPISILEAYASGCVVVTTDHGGIVDIFKDKVNGFMVLKKDSNSIKKTLEYIIANRDLLLEFALHNRFEAEMYYRKKIYLNNMLKIFNEFKRNL